MTDVLIPTPVIDEPDTVPEGGFFSDVKEEAGSLFDRMKAKRSRPKGETSATPRAPRADTKPKPTKLSAAAAKTAHDRRAKRVTGLVAKAGIGINLVAMARPHSVWVVEDGVRVKQFDSLYMDDAKAVMDGADFVGGQWATLADENEHVAKAIDAMTLGGSWTAALLSLLVIIIPILANHGVVPPMVGVQFSPESIKAMIGQATEGDSAE